MTRRYVCDGSERRRRLRDPGTPLNGIDYLEVLDQETPPGFERQRLLVVRLFKPLAAPLSADNVRVSGGVRRQGIAASWAYRAGDLARGVPTSELGAAEQAALVAVVEAALGPTPSGASSSSSSSSSSGFLQLDQFLVVLLDAAGDFSSYGFALVDAGSDAPLTGFDPRASRLTFSFKAECPTDLDCAPAPCVATSSAAAPVIDYLAKDYESFRRLMLDRLAFLLPEWKERNPADLGVAVVEALAYAADHLSYEQDAVGTEAYLGTARQRVSVARHARLLGYFPDEGAAARTLLCFEVESLSSADGATLPAGVSVKTRSPARSEAPAAPAFRTLTDLTLHSALNELELYLWGAELDQALDGAVRCCLPRGATRATLDNTGDRLRPLADRELPLLIFADRRDPERRHGVLLKRLTFGEDPLFQEAGGQPQRIVEVEWDEADALPFELAVRLATAEQPAGRTNVAIWGNVALAEHGTKETERLTAIATRRAGGAPHYAVRLAKGPLTHSVPLTAMPSGVPATARGLLQRANARSRPAITVRSLSTGEAWQLRRDLLESGAFDRHFRVELDDRGRATVRFGAAMSEVEAEVEVEYFTGNGSAGSVGRDTLTVLGAAVPGISAVTNPLPAVGAREREPIEHVRMAAPRAFRVQRRAVTEADYAERAAEHPDVQRAVATRRWTGSYYTVFVSVDRKGGRPVDAAFRRELAAFLEVFRLAGEDLEIEPPSFVSLDVALTICVAPNHFRSRVKQAVLEALSAVELPGRRRGFFHPDNLTFQQPVYLSRVVEAVLAVAGVAWVDVGDDAPLRRFQRLGHAANGEIQNGVIPIGRREIARADTDPNRPEHGRVEIFAQGGL